jgi:hypothetical protein
MTTKQRLVAICSTMVIAVCLAYEPATARDGPVECEEGVHWTGCVYDDQADSLGCPDEYSPQDICDLSWEAWGCPTHQVEAGECMYTFHCIDPWDVDHGLAPATDCVAPSNG